MLAATRARSDSARFEPPAPSKGTVLRDLSIKAAQKDKGFTRERMVQLYSKGTRVCERLCTCVVPFYHIV